MATPNFKNRTLYHGDNLAFLRGMNSETVHLIATDPPFKKGRDFYATPDSLADGAHFQDRWFWKDETHATWFREMYQIYPKVWYAIMSAKQVHSNGMGAFLAFLAVRLIEMRRILRTDGSICLHIDYDAHAYVKTLMDAIFGEKNYRNEIIWNYGKSARGGKGIAKQYARNHDTILYYSKSDKWTFNPPNDFRELSFEEAKDKGFKQDERGWFKTAPRGNYTDASIRRLEKEGRIYRTRNGNIRIRYNLQERNGQVLEPFRHGSVWDDISDMMHAPKSERTGYPTQKRVPLYKRIIEVSSNRGDWVCDPFCGCATTPIAAEYSKRKWVGIDLWDKAYQVMLDRLANEGLASATGRAKNGQLILSFDKISYKTAAPVRTDDDDSPSPIFETPTKRKTKRYPHPRLQHDKLLTDFGAYCQGCGNNYSFDPRVLEVDHILPKSDGGSDDYDNLTLLCPPCNRVKRDALTLSGLQIENRKNGHLKRENEKYLKRGRASKPKRRSKRNRGRA